MNEEQTIRDALRQMYELGVVLSGQYRKRPMFGFTFGGGEFSLASTLLIENGLHTVKYFVLHTLTSCPLSVARTKDAAIAQARSFLQGPSRNLVLRDLAAIHKRALDAEAEGIERARTEAMEMRRAAAIKTERSASIPKRRREIFEKSQGQCHYCATPLTIEGRWHIEHKMPKALLGGNEPSNLVASCAPCNHKKRDMTDQEFIAQRGAG